MKTVIMTVGPQGAGKTIYCKRVVAANPLIKLISTDDFFIEKFGKIGFDPYTGEVEYVWECFWKHVQQSLKSMEVDATIILDCWNPTARDREAMQRRLKGYGAEKIVAWYFVTPSEICGHWFVKRECRERQVYGESRRVYARMFHQRAEDVRRGAGFDAVHFINPLQLQLFPEVFPL